MDIVLASKSPRRLELLSMLGHYVTVKVSDADETSVNINDAKLLSQKLAEIKAKTVADKCTNHDIPVIGADTLVEADGIILGKPKDKNDAERMIRMLSGKSHNVYTGYCVIYKDKLISGYEGATVDFRDIAENELRAYIESDEPYDKAGAYGIQGKASAFVKSINGDYFSIVGLPVCRISQILNDIENERHKI